MSFKYICMCVNVPLRLRKLMRNCMRTHTHIHTHLQIYIRTYLLSIHLQCERTQVHANALQTHSHTCVRHRMRETQIYFAIYH